MRNKKGSHVDVIVSFVLFIVFVIFLFVLVKPGTDFSKNHKQTADSIKVSLENRTKGEVTVVNLINGSSKNGENCISLEESGLEVSGLSFIAKDKEGNSLDVYDSSGRLEISWKDNSGFFKVLYSSEEFNSHSANSGMNCLVGKIKSTRVSKEYLESKILAFISFYDTDYENLKKELGISDREDFGFQFDYGNGTALGPEIPNVNVEIFAEEYQIDYLDKEGNRKFGTFLIYVWG